MEAPRNSTPTPHRGLRVTIPPAAPTPPNYRGRHRFVEGVTLAERTVHHLLQELGALPNSPAAGVDSAIAR